MLRARVVLAPRHVAAAVRAASPLTRRATQDAGAQEDGSLGAALVHVELTPQVNLTALTGEG